MVPGVATSRALLPLCALFCFHESFQAKGNISIRLMADYCCELKCCALGRVIAVKVSVCLEQTEDRNATEEIESEIYLPVYLYLTPDPLN